MPTPTPLSIPAAITKAQVAETVAFHGKVNSLPVELGGVEHAARTVRYVTFAGALDVKRGLYVGEHCVASVKASPSDVAKDLNELPGLNGGA